MALWLVQRPYGSRVCDATGAVIDALQSRSPARAVERPYKVVRGVESNNPSSNRKRKSKRSCWRRFCNLFRRCRRPTKVSARTPLIGGTGSRQSSDRSLLIDVQSSMVTSLEAPVRRASTSVSEGNCMTWYHSRRLHRVFQDRIFVKVS